MQSLKMLKTFGLLIVLMVSFTRVEAADIPIGPFSDPVNDLGSLSVGNTYLFDAFFQGQGPFSQIFNFDFAGPGSLGVSLMPDPSGNGLFNGNSLDFSLSNNVLNITGISTGTIGFGYQVQIAAVPEPEEWAMLLAGLCLVGLKFSRLRREDEESTKLDVTFA